jgi:hypothetical protein
MPVNGFFNLCTYFFGYRKISNSMAPPPAPNRSSQKACKDRFSHGIDKIKKCNEVLGINFIAFFYFVDFV